MTKQSTPKGQEGKRCKTCDPKNEGIGCAGHTSSYHKHAVTNEAVKEYEEKALRNLDIAYRNFFRLP